MEKKKVVPIWVSVVLLALCAACIVGVAYLFTKESRILPVVTYVLFLCAIAMAVLYCFMGYKKNASKFFSIFSIVLALVVLLQITNNGTIRNQPRNFQETAIAVESTMEMPQAEMPTDQNSGIRVKNVVKIVTPVLIFGALFTLAISKDLGRKKSYTLISSSVILSLINFIVSFVGTKNNIFDFDSFTVAGAEFSILILCVIYGIMIYAKYQDKEARGTK